MSAIIESPTPSDFGFDPIGAWIDGDGFRYAASLDGPHCLCNLGQHSRDAFVWNLRVWPRTGSGVRGRVSAETDHLSHELLGLNRRERQAEFGEALLTAARLALFHGRLDPTQETSVNFSGENELGLGYGRAGMPVPEMATAKFWVKEYADHEEKLQLYVRKTLLGVLRPKRLTGVACAVVAEAIPVTEKVLRGEIDTFLRMGLVSQDEQTLQITDAGAAALQELERGNVRFLAPGPASTTNILHVGTISNSAVQQAGSGSTQTASFDMGRRSELVEVLSQLKTQLPCSSLDEADKNEVVAQVTTIEGQLRSKSPRPDIVGTALMTIADIVTGTAGGLGAALIAKLAGLTPP